MERDFVSMQVKWKNFSKEQIQGFANESRSYRELATKLGYSPNGGGSMDSVKKMIDELSINIEHFTGQGWNKENFDYDRFKYGNVIKVADALPALASLRGRKCESCQLEEWQGELIPLEIHHIDGDKLNNTLENLQILCPNCHALTDNWRGKNINKSKKEPIKDEVFVSALQECSSIRQALIKLGLSPRGGNYDRAHELIVKYNITKFIK